MAPWLDGSGPVVGICLRAAGGFDDDEDAVVAVVVVESGAGEPVRCGRRAMPPTGPIPKNDGPDEDDEVVDAVDTGGYPWDRLGAAAAAAEVVGEYRFRFEPGTVARSSSSGLVVVIPSGVE